MQKRVLGKTELRVSVIGFGGIPIQRLPMRKARELVRQALDMGINFFDTAQGYGDSEIKREKRCLHIGYKVSLPHEKGSLISC